MSSDPSMQHPFHRSAVFAGMLLYAALAALSVGAAQGASSKSDQQSRAAQKKSAAHSRHVRPTSSPTDMLQMARLRYLGLSALPQKTRGEFHADLRAAIDDAEARCSRLPGTRSSDTIMPCLGLYHGGEVRSPIKFSFDLALKSVGAPKDIFVGQCPAGSNNAACNNIIGETKAEQERLADTLNRQRRYPVATLGVAVSF